MIDAILYVPDFTTLVGYLDQNHPDMLERDEEGNMVMPPVVTGFSRTPATATSDGNSLLVYARLRDKEVDQWRGMPHVEVLSEQPFTGPGTGQAVYDAIFTDAIKDAKYKGVYDYTPYQADDGEGGTVTVAPPKMFGLLAGA